MKLVAINIQNFKGIKDLNVNTEGKNLNIYGDNGTGKTTIADAYTWLLTGKDSKGSTKFDIYPKDAADGVNASVTGRFINAAGDSFTLQRIVFMDFVRKNGEAEQKLKGNKTNCFINGVPKTLNDYNSFIEEQFGSEQKLMMLTDPDYFAGKLDYKERRDILIKTFAPHYDDTDVIKNHEELSPLSDYIGAMTTVAELTEQLKAERKKINSRLNEIPGRIDENEKSRIEIAPPAENDIISKLVIKRQEQQNKLIALQSGLDASNLELALNKKLTAKAQAEQDYIKDNFNTNDRTEERLSTLRKNLQECKMSISNLENDIAMRAKFVDGLEKEMAELRSQYVRKASEHFNDELTVCPTCGQTFDDSKISLLKDNFNTNKAAAMERIQRDGKEKKALCASYCDQLNEFKSKLSTKQDELVSINNLINDLSQTVIKPIPFADTDICTTYNVQIEALRQQISEVKSSQDTKIAAAMEELSVTDKQLSQLKDREGDVERNNQIDKRIKELMNEEKALGKLLAKKENLLNLTESFVKLQAADITNRVNSAFKYVKWKLFGTQVNGGTKPCCEAVIDGVAYTSNLNTAAKLNAGLDIINTLTKASGFDTLPIFIDNAESVTKYIDVNAQIIKLYVNEYDTALRMEVQI